MATKWTAAQIAAINTKNKTLLLSAAAGSGKTTTLTQRIISAITDPEKPADISKMLIVTFTRASAADLKAKIFNAVSKELAKDPQNKHLSKQLIKLGSAQISTIDSFYLNAVRQNFSALDISSSFRIADSSETNLLAKSIIKDVIEDFHNSSSDFSSLCECFEGIRDTEGVMEGVLLDLYVSCMRTPEGVDYLKRVSVEAFSGIITGFLDSSYGTIIRDHTLSVVEGYLESYDYVLEKMSLDEKLFASYYDAMNSDRVLLIDLLDLLSKEKETHEYTAVADAINYYEFPAMKPFPSKFASPLSVFSRALRDSFKDDLNTLREEYYSYSKNDLSRFFALTAENLDLLWHVLSNFEIRYNEEKARRNILELTDIKRLAFKLFVNADGTPTKLARKTAEQFTDIYIDEYQDVDPVQDLIFRAISKPDNRFMVGDIKQSIYSFRGAKPQLFADYRALFSAHGSQDAESSTCETIFMSENFRCSKPVIDFTNAVCAPIFTACKDSIGYTEEDDLVYSKGTPEDAEKSLPISVSIFAKNSKKLISDDVDVSALLSPAEAEAKYIAKSIYDLIHDGKKENGEPFRPCDIAVLFRNKSTANRIADALSELGIKSNNSDASKYFQNPDVMMALCILNAVDNPQRDIQLAGALKSPIFNFTMEDLLLISKSGSATDSLYDKLCIYCTENSPLGQKCREFNNTLEKWRTISVSMPIDRFLSHVFSSEHFVASGLMCERGSTAEGGNLQRLYDYARTFEVGSFKGLYNFIEFINSIIENGEMMNVSDEGGDEDSVTLTTIHKSKGLEFPVCFVCNCASAFNTGSSNPHLTFEYGIGVAMTLSDNTGFAYYSSPLKKALDLNAKIKGIEEEMRVLYVALTRAKERLYITGSYSRSVMTGILERKKFLEIFNCPHSILSAESYMDWILPRLDSCEPFAHLDVYTTDRLPTFQASRRAELSDEGKDTLNVELYQKLQKKFAFQYPYPDLQKIPAKLSVSKLSPDVLDIGDTSLSLFDRTIEPTVPDFFLSTKKKASSTERGTATHLFLQFCDFGVLHRQGVAESIAMLTEKRFIPKNIAEIVYSDDLESLRQSEFLQEVLSAKRIIREQRFSTLLPTAAFTRVPDFRENVKNETIAVQGVIDIIVIDENGDVSLYDYKTDRLTKEELFDENLASKKLNERHAMQLSYYAKAVESMFGKPPKRVAIYSTHAARLFDIEPCSLIIPPDIL